LLVRLKEYFQRYHEVMMKTPRSYNVTFAKLLPTSLRRHLAMIGVIFLLCFLPVHGFGAAKADPSKGPVTIEAHSIAYDKAKDTYHAKGDVLIVFSGGLLLAESATLNRTSNDALAEGYVMIISNDDILEGDKVNFNIETETGIAYEGKMFLAKNHFYLSGSTIEKTGEATYRINDATVTSCDGNSPDWRLKGSEMNVTIDGYGTLKNSKLLAKDIPVFYTPYLLFPAKTTRQSGFLPPHLSYSQNKLGADVELPFYWAISENTDATFYQRYMGQRGFKEGAEFRYFLSKNSFGTFYGDFMNDTWHGKESYTYEATTGVTTGVMTGVTRSRDWQSDHKRWSYYLNHETTFSPSIFFRTDIKKVSDNWYFKDFSSHNYYRENYSQKETNRFRKVSFVGDESLGSLDSTARLVKNWQLYSLTALVRYTDDFASASNDATLQKYPEIFLKGIKQPLWGTPLYFELDATYDYYYRNEGAKGHFNDLQPVLSLPLRWRDYLQVTPQIGVKSTFWNRDDSFDTVNTVYSKNGDREMYTAGATAKTELHRIFDIGGEVIDKIRHGIMPELTYTYVSHAYQDDAPDFVTRIPEQNTLTYSLTNTLLARLNEKGGAKSYREFLRFKLSQTYDFKEARRGETILPADNKPFSDIDMELDVKPFQYFSLLARNKYSLNSSEWKQTSYDVYISDWRGDSATLGYRHIKSVTNEIMPSGSSAPFAPYHYAQVPLEEINLSLKAMLTNHLSLIHVYRRNELDNQIIEKTYGFNYSKQCWTVEVKYTETHDDKQYMVALTLYGLGRFGGK
jgi:LPS-assembly protein